jgi:hypothetical protein
LAPANAYYVVDAITCARRSGAESDRQLTIDVATRSRRGYDGTDCRIRSDAVVSNGARTGL